MEKSIGKPKRRRDTDTDSEAAAKKQRQPAGDDEPTISSEENAEQDQEQEEQDDEEAEAAAAAEEEEEEEEEEAEEEEEEEEEEQDDKVDEEDEGSEGLRARGLKSPGAASHNPKITSISSKFRIGSSKRVSSTTSNGHDTSSSAGPGSLRSQIPSAVLAVSASHGSHDPSPRSRSAPGPAGGKDSQVDGDKRDDKKGDEKPRGDGAEAEKRTGGLTDADRRQAAALLASPTASLKQVFCSSS